MSLNDTIRSDMKAAMRSGEKDRLSVIRMLLAAIKQREIDERIELTDSDVLQIVEKLVKQSREAANQFGSADRKDLEQKELAEIEVLKTYLPEPLSEAALDELITTAIKETGAASMRDMGQVMNRVREQAQGRADMSAVSAKVKSQLGS
jgi:uncharacterized protein YqeY